jgi:hypothetical protein
MKASALCFQSAVVFVIAGMIWGIIMGISQDFSAAPAHAHLNLLGWVSLFLFGIYYRLHPSFEGAKTALVQVWVWIIGTIVFTIGIELVGTGKASGEPVVGVGAFVVLIDVLLFGWLVFQGERPDASVRPMASSAR